MAVARGEVLIQLAHGVLVVGLVFLVVEVHQLRVAVENDRLAGYDGEGEERLDGLAGLAGLKATVESLDQPLKTIGQRLGRVSAALDRQALPGAARGVPAGSAPDRAATDAAPAATNNDRRLIATGLESRLHSLVTAAKEEIENRSKVTTASLPSRSSGAATMKVMQVVAVKRTLAALQSSQTDRSQFLMMTPQELLARYGKPTSITVREKGQIRWWYEPVRHGSSWLSFTLYDGRVIQVEWN
ncbi:MAG: hypothetical protein ACYTGW_03155 [Planctomycetota bacterium]